jgi:putative ABC transport system permease protein
MPTAVLARQYRQEHPAAAPDADPDSHLNLTVLQDSIVSGIRQSLLILMAAVGLVLSIACANVASLSMARATGRAKEIAMRAALGASRGMLVRQLLGESVLLAAAGAALGAVLANRVVAWLVRSGGAALPGFQPVRVDLAVLGFTAVVGVATGIAFGLLPALPASRPDLNSVLRDSGWGTTGGARCHRARGVLVAAQVALSIVLLIGAGLLIESFRRVASINPGFDPQHGVTMRVNLPPAKYPDGARRVQFYREAIERISAIPGVRSATASMALPLMANLYSPVLADGQPFVQIARRPLVQWNAVTPGYFQSLGIPIDRGRDFSWSDDERAPRAIVVSQSIARRFWPNEEALGKHLTFTRFQAPYEIVGIVGDVKNTGLESDPGMVMYSSYPQWTFPGMSITLRTAGDPHPFERAAQAQILAVDRDQPIAGVRTLDEVVDGVLSQRRQTMYLIAAFAALALLLALVGLYGVMAYFVAQRRMEIGIRRAIGAQGVDILRLVLGQAIRVCLAGIAAGVIAALALTRLIANMLYHVSATDPVTFAAIAIVFLLVALAASYIPAWRATRVDPLEALRYR